MRATTQPCARTLREEAEKPSSTDAPKTKTLTPFETRIIILVWLRPLFALFALRITKVEQPGNVPGANSWVSRANWQPEFLHGVLIANSDDQKKWTIQFTPATGDRAKYVAHAALLGFGLIPKGRSDEKNEARSAYDFVVLAFTEKSLAKETNNHRGELELKRKNDVSPKRTAVAVWVTPDKKLQPVQALGGWLNLTNE